MTTGIDLIAEERQRQIDEEGWTAKHDDEHKTGHLALAAALYATPIKLYGLNSSPTSLVAFDPWPWVVTHNVDGAHVHSKHWDKRMKHPRLRQLAIAGALIAAEMDRLMRAELAKQPIADDGAMPDDNGREDA